LLGAALKDGHRIEEMKENVCVLCALNVCALDVYYAQDVFCALITG